MAVVSVNLLFTGRGGKETFERQRTYKRVYEVITDNPNEAEQVVGNAVGIPQLGTPFFTDPYAVVVDVDVEQSEASDLIWLVTVSFDSKPKMPAAVDPNGTTHDPVAANTQDPLARPAQWRFSSIDTEEPLTEWRRVKADGTPVFTNPANWAATTAYALGAYVQAAGMVYRCTIAGTSGAFGPSFTLTDGSVTWVLWSSLADALADPNAAILVAVANSGSFPFDPPPMETVSKPMIQVTKAVPLITLEYLMLMKNAVNSTTWRNIPPRCAKCLTIEASNKQENGVSFVEACWHIALDPDTFDRRILDCGYGSVRTILIPTAPGFKKGFVEFTDDNGQPYTSPVPMDGSGNKLGATDPPVYLRGIPRQTKVVDFNAQLPF